LAKKKVASAALRRSIPVKAAAALTAPPTRKSAASLARSNPAEHGYEDFAFDHQRAWSFYLKAYKVVVGALDKGLREQSRISLAEYELLLYINHVGGRIRFIDLARITLLSQSRISRQIDALQRKGFLKREITDSDRRATFAVLTAEGRKAWDEAQLPFASVFHANFLDLIPEDRLAGFSDILRRLLQDPHHFTVTRDIVNQTKAKNAKR
jgi:DNA-binding MarR family transcriptional regulator